MKKITAQILSINWIYLTVIYTRFFLGVSFVFAAIIKIKGKRFTSLSGEDDPIHSPAHFFETIYQTGLYWNFLGWTQLIAGFLLLTQRYAKLGAVLYFPIILNIFIITVSLNFNYTFVITTLMLLGNILLLCWHWNELRILVNLPVAATSDAKKENSRVWEMTGLFLFLFTTGYRILYDQYSFLFWLMGSLLIMLIGLIVATRKNLVFSVTER
jgi:hypothetical protein